MVSTTRLAAKAAHRLMTLGVSAVLVIAVGCDDSSEQAKTPPPNQPAVVAPPTTLPSPELASAKLPAVPVSSYLWLREVPDPRKSQADVEPATATDTDPNGVAVQFPRARLRLSGKGEDRMIAMLYSDDPKEAINKGWQGDRYYFRMPLRVGDVQQLDDAPYRMAVPFEGQDETSNGVFRMGDRYHMEPIDLMVRFEPEGSQVKIFLGGLFKQYDTSDVSAEPKWFHVQGIIQAVVE